MARVVHMVDVDVRPRLGEGEPSLVFPTSCSCGQMLGTYRSRQDAMVVFYGHLRQPPPVKAEQEDRRDERPQWTRELRVRRKVVDAR